MKKYLGICFLILLSASAWGKEAPTSLPLIPGEVAKGSGGDQIILEQGRLLFWPNQGPLLLKGKGGAVLAKIDLTTKVKKQSGTEALGLEVEEKDLGGSRGAKSYLAGKKDPHGRKLDSEVLAGRSQAAQAGQKKQSVVLGITLTTIDYPNGSSLLRLAWPDLTEEIYFDRRKTMVYDQQSRKIAPFLYILKQYADGSFLRTYHAKDGELNYTYDANDKSYNLVFSNSQGETVQEINCQENCSVE